MNDAIGFVNKAKVEGIELKYDVKEKWMKRPSDIQLIVKFKLQDNPKVDWEKTLKINGNFNKQKEHWGSALKAKMFFEACGVKNAEYNEDYTIPESYIDQCMDKEFLILSYPSVKIKDNGKNWWNDWSEVCSVERGMDYLKKRFADAVAQKYVADYNFNPNSNTIIDTKSSNTSNKAETVDFDDMDI